MIDHTQLDTLIQFLGKDTINQIRLEYVEDSSHRMTLLLAAWKDRDYQKLQQISHSLKSASLNMAMQVFAKQCQLIEAYASQHNEQGIQAIMDGLLALHKVSLKELATCFS